MHFLHQKNIPEQRIERISHNMNTFIPLNILQFPEVTLNKH